MLKVALIGLALFATGAQSAVIEYKSTGPLAAAIEEVLNSLPSGYLDSVNKTISIEEENLKSDQKFISEDLCRIDEGVKFGYTKKNRIRISSRLIQLAQTNSKSFPCGHRTFKNHLKAVLIHELTHVKDNEEKISLEPDFQRIVGMKKITGNSKKRLMNQNVSSSPDAYEFLNLEEALAVNVEYLILDPEFECRKPATANYLARRLSIPLKGQCRKNYKVIAQSAFLEDNYQAAFNIDPSRIYQIHYLFAGKGRALMSRWGHAMFRLVVCAPHRKIAGPECLEDVSYHLALSYRAHMSDINISYAKGVFGGYPSQLFIMRYLEVQQEYTKFELRDLFSIPLKMTAQQKKEFIDVTLERFWTYQGKYYFIDNNCGTETVKHLEVVLSEDEAKLVSSITPLRIYNDIVRHGNDLTDENIQGLSRDQMAQKRLLVESMYSQLNESYQFLRQYIPSFREKKLEKFLKKTSASHRQDQYSELIRTSPSLSTDIRRQIAMKLVHLERYLASRFLMEVPKKAIAKMDKDPELKAEVMKMGQTLKLLSVQPWEVVRPSYGVPTEDEFELQFPAFKEKRNSELKASMEGQLVNLQNILGKKYFEKELAELETLKIIKKMTSDFVLEVTNFK